MTNPNAPKHNPGFIEFEKENAKGQLRELRAKIEGNLSTADKIPNDSTLRQDSDKIKALDEKISAMKAEINTVIIKLKTQFAADTNFVSALNTYETEFLAKFASAINANDVPTRLVQTRNAFERLALVGEKDDTKNDSELGELFEAVEKITVSKPVGDVATLSDRIKAENTEKEPGNLMNLYLKFQELMIKFQKVMNFSGDEATAAKIGLEMKKFQNEKINILGLAGIRSLLRSAIESKSNSTLRLQYGLEDKDALTLFRNKFSIYVQQKEVGGIPFDGSVDEFVNVLVDEYLTDSGFFKNPSPTTREITMSGIMKGYTSKELPAPPESIIGKTTTIDVNLVAYQIDVRGSELCVGLSGGDLMTFQMYADSVDKKRKDPAATVPIEFKKAECHKNSNGVPEALLFSITAGKFGGVSSLDRTFALPVSCVEALAKGDHQKLSEQLKGLKFSLPLGLFEQDAELRIVAKKR